MIPGDGVGPDLMYSVQDVIKAAGAPLDFEVLNLSEVSYHCISNCKYYFYFDMQYKLSQVSQGFVSLKHRYKTRTFPCWKVFSSTVRLDQGSGSVLRHLWPL